MAKLEDLIVEKGEEHGVKKRVKYRNATSEKKKKKKKKKRLYGIMAMIAK